MIDSISHGLRRAGILVVILSVMLSAGATAASLPEFRLDEVPAPVRQAIEQASQAVEQAKGADDSAALAEAWGRLADVALAHEFASQARVAYQRALELDPQRHDWHYLLGMVESSEGNNRGAIAAFTQVLELRPDEHLALLRRAQAWLDEGNLDRAEADFWDVLAHSAQEPAAHGGLGRVALQREDYQQAVNHLRQALELSPAASRLHHMLGMAYRGLGNVEQARVHLGQRGDVLEPVEDPLLGRVQAQSRNPQFYLEMGLSQADLGNMQAALRLLESAVQLAPDDPPILTNYGELLARTGHLDQAYEVFRRLTRLQPARAQPHFYLGQIEELRGNLDSAVQSYRHLLGMTPEDHQVRSALAWALLALGRYDEAAERFDQAAGLIDDAARQSVYAYWQGMARLGGGQCDAGAASLERARTLGSGPDADLLSALARVRATCQPAEGEALEQALEWARAVYDAQPGLMSAETLAMVYARLGRFDDAIDLQAQAMFEAVKAGELQARPSMQQNMQRYQEQRPATQPFGENDPAFSARFGNGAP